MVGSAEADAPGSGVPGFRQSNIKKPPEGGIRFNDEEQARDGCLVRLHQNLCFRPTRKKRPMAPE